MSAEHGEGRNGRGWLLVLGVREGIRWVLEQEAMAFSKGGCARARHIATGDRLVFYTTRGAYHNPTRDVAQLIGIGTATSAVRDFERPVRIAGREFTCGCEVDFDLILPEREGLEAAPVMKRLSFVKKPAVWGQYVRSSPVRLSPKDLQLVTEALEGYKASRSRSR